MANADSHLTCVDSISYRPVCSKECRWRLLWQFHPIDQYWQLGKRKEMAQYDLKTICLLMFLKPSWSSIVWCGWALMSQWHTLTQGQRWAVDHDSSEQDLQTRKTRMPQLPLSHLVILHRTRVSLTVWMIKSTVPSRRVALLKRNSRYCWTEQARNWVGQHHDTQAQDNTVYVIRPVCGYSDLWMCKIISNCVLTLHCKCTCISVNVFMNLHFNRRLRVTHYEWLIWM